ncbi:tetratricopeptide repeat-containing protein [Besnoitia besnoiti]|uniref:Tetratricopeptide repeat-containing protein n=1 Tax=Besnoitia besnoiti TaxID=94643 RepID=A0A2A9MGK8_BESBE|nr:tetratricopeptide repeat-containing protein [Besnoitia besnoiti]PFH35391.1 tetratricopeptide repeat-containing protein [Besnoitia besnoiti]
MPADDDVSLLDIDFEKVESCTQPRLLRKYIALLEQDGSYYHQLLAAARSRLESLASSGHASNIRATRLPRGPSASDITAAKADILQWQRSLNQHKCADRCGHVPPVSNPPGGQDTQYADGHHTDAVPAKTGNMSTGCRMDDSPEADKNHGRQEDFSEQMDLREGRIKKSGTQETTGACDCSADGTGADEIDRGQRSKTHCLSSTRHPCLSIRAEDIDAFLVVSKAGEKGCHHDSTETRTSHSPLRKCISVVIEDSEVTDGEPDDSVNDVKQKRDGDNADGGSMIRQISPASGTASVQVRCRSGRRRNSPSCRASLPESHGTTVLGLRSDERKDLNEISPQRMDVGPSIRRLSPNTEEEAQSSDYSRHALDPNVGHSENPLASETGRINSIRVNQVIKLKRAAVAAYDVGNFEEALRHLTKCLELAEGDVAADEGEQILPFRQLRDAPLCCVNRPAKTALPPKLHSVIYCNRSQVHLVLKQYADAAEDGLRAMQLDGTNIKALWRRARALHALGGAGNLQQAKNLTNKIKMAFLAGATNLPRSALDHLSELQAVIQRASEKV